MTSYAVHFDRPRSRGTPVFDGEADASVEVSDQRDVI